MSKRAQCVVLLLIGIIDPNWVFDVNLRCNSAINCQMFQSNLDL